MDQAFWENRWTSGQIRFHEGKPNRFLLQFVDRLGAPGSVFVPLCGKSVDLDALAARGFQVTGCELVERAVLDYFGERGLLPSVTRRAESEIYEAGPVRLVRGDVLAYEPEEGPFDAAYDRAALIALPADVRRRYAERIATLLRPGGRVLLVTIEHDAGAGPPFDVGVSEVRELFAGPFDVEELAHEEVLADNPHIVQKGATRVSERALLLTRRTRPV